MPIAKQIWDAVGTANPESDGEPDAFEVVGPNRVTGLPMFIPISYQEIAHCLRRDSMSLVLAIDRILETVPAILIKPLFSRGIFLTGEGLLCVVSLNASRRPFAFLVLPSFPPTDSRSPDLPIAISFRPLSPLADGGGFLFAPSLGRPQ